MNKLIAHPSTKKNIDAFIQNPSHGLMISGMQFSGKTHVAKYIISSLLNTSIDNLDNYPFLMILGKKDSKISIDDIRAMKEFLKLKTYGDKSIRRFVLVDAEQGLGFEAQNAMLKILEEPPQDTCIIVMSRSHESLKPTIISRLNVIKIKPLSEGQIKSFVENPDKIEKIINISEGLPGLISALTNKEETHFQNYIDDAKKFITLNRTEKLIQADKISKSKNYDLDLLLASIYKILNIKLRQASKNQSKKDIEYFINKLELVHKLRSKQQNNTQAKLLLTKLAYDL